MSLLIKNIDIIIVHIIVFSVHYLVIGDGSDSSDVEIVEVPAGSIPVRGSRGRNGRGGGRGEGRSDLGEGTSRGPGDLGSNFNPSKY